MNRKLLFCLPLTLLLCVLAFATPGSAEDPLISRDYLNGTYLGAVSGQIDAALNTSDAALLEAAKAEWSKALAKAEVNALAKTRADFAELRLKRGDILSGLTGLQVVPIAGELTLSFDSGAVVDVTTGAEVPSGTVLTLGHRYIVAEDTVALFLVSGKTALFNYCGTYHFTYSATPDYIAMATALKSLSLFKGSDYAFGSGYELEAVPTRIQALIMLIRLLGEEQSALACTSEHPFADVPEWCEPYVAYAYEKGYSNGVGKNSEGKDLFGTTMESSAAQYTEFILRALGYSSTATTEIADAPERALASGVITEGECAALKDGSFLRADVVYLSYYALSAQRSGSAEALCTQLIRAGVFSHEQYRAAQSAVTTQRIG